MVATLMISAKLATVGVLKVKVFWNTGYSVINSVHDVTSKTVSRDSSYIVNVINWPKFRNFSISILQGFDQKKNDFFEGCSWFKFNNLGLALGMALKFYTSLAKPLKLKVIKSLGLIPTFVQVTGGKLVRGTFLPLLPRPKYG